MAAALTVLLVAIALGAVGQIFLKMGVTQVKQDYAESQGVALAEVDDKVPATYILKSFVIKPLILIGFLCYGVSSMFYLVSLSRLDLSYAYPLIAFSYVMVAILSWWLLGESLPAMRVVGLAVVLIGVALLGISYSDASSGPVASEVIESTTVAGDDVRR
jgi:multidrug transporter EmrE-like cation transporter